MDKEDSFEQVCLRSLTNPGGSRVRGFAVAVGAEREVADRVASRGVADSERGLPRRSANREGG